MKIERLFLIAAFIMLAAVIIFCCGCATDQSKRERLEKEYPDCFIMHDFTIECPNPFTDQSVGFGASVTNQKPKRKKKNERSR